jgi:hypothetical protein
MRLAWAMSLMVMGLALGGDRHGLATGSANARPVSPLTKADGVGLANAPGRVGSLCLKGNETP